jgi:hypothetical protein
VTVATRALFTGSLVLPHTPTVAGTPFTITNDTKYNAWPVMCRLGDGSLLLGYTKGDSHHNDNTAKAVCKVSTDEGSTWGSEVTVYDHASLFSTIYGLAVTRTGRVIATLWRDDYDTAGTGEAGIVYSDDGGATWSSWVALASSFTQEAYGAGPAIICGNGDLLLTIEGSNTGQPILNRSCHTLRSSDDGLTWGSEVTVRNYDSRPYYESKLIPLRDGTLRCLHRTSGGTGTHYVSTSTDDGLSWGAPASIFAGYGAPSVCRLSNDDVVAVTRRNSDAACVAYTSEDGLSWAGPIVVDSSMYEMEYGAPVQLADGTVLVVYGYQPTSAITNSDIKGCVLS